MHASEIDQIWFRAHPQRAFRLRRQTPAEIAKWPVQPPAGATAWCVIRKEDGVLEAFALKDGDTWGDYDEELAPFFEDLRGNAA